MTFPPFDEWKHVLGNNVHGCPLCGALVHRDFASVHINWHDHVLPDEAHPKRTVRTASPYDLNAVSRRR